MNPKISRWLWFFTVLEGLAALFWVAAQPSEIESAFILGLSKPRLVLALLILLLTLASAWVAGRTWRSPTWEQRVGDWVGLRLIHPQMLTPTLLFLLLTVFLVAVFVMVVFLFPAYYEILIITIGDGIILLYAVMVRLLPLVVWGGLVALQNAGFLIWQYASLLRQRNSWQLRPLFKTFGVYVLALLTLSHWIILIFQLKVFNLMPGWFWGFYAKPFTPRLIVFGFMLLGLLAAGWLVLKHPRSTWVVLGALYLLGLGLQLGIGVAEGQGVESLRQRFFASMHKSYALSACGKDESLSDIVVNYESTYGLKMFPGTKPPGVILVYAALERSVNAIWPLNDYEARCNRLGQTIAWFFPLVAFMVVVVLYLLVTYIADAAKSQVRYLAPLLFLTAPNIMLFALFLDEALYPLLFLTGSILLVMVARSRRVWLAFLGGCFLYFMIFISFSMLPLFAFLGCYWFLLFWIGDAKKNWKSELLKMMMVVVGFLCMHLILKTMLNYDFLVRYQNAFRSVYEFEYVIREGSVKVGETSYLDRLRLAVGLNNVEFATSIGIPLYVLFIVQAVCQVTGLFQRRLQPLQMITTAYFGTFVLLQLISPTRGEMARLWLFWVPVMALLASMELESWLKQRSWLLYVFLTAQWGTLMLLYLFQDLK